MSTHVLNMPNGVIKSEPHDSTPLQVTTPTIKMEPSRKLSPSHKLSLTGPQCMVCEDAAPTEGGFRRHYGVICCEACKCFFRRTVQMSRDYKCRFGGKCAIGRTAVNLKQICQACRFNQCLKAGMKIDSVKKFPRKVRGDEPAKKQKKPARLYKDKLPLTGSDSNTATPAANGIDTKYNQSSVTSPQSGKSESDIEELSHLKFNVNSPETLLILENTNVGQLLNSDSLENLNRVALTSPTGPKAPKENSKESVSVSNASKTSSSSANPPAPVGGVVKSTANGVCSNPMGKLRRQSENDATFFFPPTPAANWPVKKPNDHSSVTSGHTPFISPLSPSKRPRIDSTGSAVEMMSYHSSPSYILNGNSTPHTPLPNTHSRPSSPDPGMSVYNSHNNTPTHSPLSSPTTRPSHPPTNYLTNTQAQFTPKNFNSQTGGLILPSSKSSLTQLNSQRFTASPSGMSQLTLPGFTRPNNLLALQQTAGNTFLFPSSQMPLGMASLFPVVQLGPFSPSTLTLGEQKLLPSMMQMQGMTGQSSSGGGGGLMGSSGKSPFSIVPIPSINKTQPPEEPECAEVSQISGEMETQTAERVTSTSPSARSSPVGTKPKSRATLPEANVEEVLDSLRLRIRSMFKWAKSEVAGFDDLSPLDQKALLRKTVAELVMLGFARGSIAYENVLLLGSTGAVLQPTNVNPGIASVASVTLEKLVVPLKVLNINDKELRLLKEIVLFNPEANGLRNREIVRQYRKRKHIELMEHTEKNSGDPGRFGELMCLLTPLYEVGLEVTEQLRLEQFVHEGEARIDALLLMSMISGAEEMPAESTVDQ